MFNPNYVYPSDGTGQYIEVDGEIYSISFSTDIVTIKIIDKDGNRYTGYGEKTFIDALQDNYITYNYATIRIYNQGGGYYPDNRIISVYVGNIL